LDSSSPRPSDRLDQGVTITGGLNNSQPDDVVTLGGRRLDPAGRRLATGASVTIATA